MTRLCMMTICALAWASLASASPPTALPPSPGKPALQPLAVRVLTFNILQGGAEAANVGFANRRFGGSRIDELVEVIELSEAEIVAVQEDCPSDRLLKALGEPWQREGSIYSKYPIQQRSLARYLAVVRICLPGDRWLTVVNCHWFPKRHAYGPDVVQKDLREKRVPDDRRAYAKRVARAVENRAGPRGYDATLRPLREAIRRGEHVVLCGDFNEPSHLDWTERAAAGGPDRWVKNPTQTPLRFAIEWPGSKALQEAGLVDGYRAVHGDEVRHAGITWTPAYPDGTPGRRPYADQVLERIDRIYFAGPGVEATAAGVVGEDEKTCELVYRGRWPSDHRAVVVTLRLR